MDLLQLPELAVKGQLAALIEELAGQPEEVNANLVNTLGWCVQFAILYVPKV